MLSLSSSLCPNLYGANYFCLEVTGKKMVLNEKEKHDIPFSTLLKTGIMKISTPLPLLVQIKYHSVCLTLSTFKRRIWTVMCTLNRKRENVPSCIQGLLKDSQPNKEQILAPFKSVELDTVPARIQRSSLRKLLSCVWKSKPSRLQDHVCNPWFNMCFITQDSTVMAHSWRT